MSEEQKVEEAPKEEEQKEEEQGEEESKSSLSEEDTLKIVQHFLLSSPPGEFEDVLADVREIVSNDELLNKGAFEIFHTYNIEQLIPVEVEIEKKYKVILSKYSEIDATHYMEPISDKIITVDHTKGTVTEVADNTSPMDEAVKKTRDTIQKEVDKYIEDHFVNGTCSIFPIKKESEVEYIVCVSASKFNEKNFWSGRWRSVYRITIDSSKKAKISGSMKVNVHYYESGNVQLNTAKEYGETVDASSDDVLAVAVQKLMDKTESSFQSDIDTACTNLNETFKSLRKRLPYTKQLFDFSSSTSKLTSEMAK